MIFKILIVFEIVILLVLFFFCKMFFEVVTTDRAAFIDCEPWFAALSMKDVTTRKSFNGLVWGARDVPGTKP